MIVLCHVDEMLREFLLRVRRGRLHQGEDLVRLGIFIIIGQQNVIEMIFPGLWRFGFLRGIVRNITAFFRFLLFNRGLLGGFLRFYLGEFLALGLVFFDVI